MLNDAGDNDYNHLTQHKALKDDNNDQAYGHGDCGDNHDDHIPTRLKKRPFKIISCRS